MAEMPGRCYVGECGEVSIQMRQDEMEVLTVCIEYSFLVR
jgi:hypothetical protein